MGPTIEAYTKEREDASSAFDLLLWVDDGWLSGVEIVDYLGEHHGNDSPDEIPPVDRWDDPRPYTSAA